MALNIRNQEAEKLAEALAAITGETKTQAVTEALRERLEALKRRKSRRSVADRLDEIAKHCASLPILDQRSQDEILGYDEQGLPT
ncbi:MAG: type II toxin-antitoxin system VapB family antitoxin [Nitrospirota bacterium]|jgi:antitoxin VapB|nr:type II toxin-antitoxin system VapB family antitoxin [Nitrospirota bacterium]MDH5699640.1 type II toxin-antitoxin system VapB family antitoxin [Nitrospirota bacterium]